MCRSIPSRSRNGTPAICPAATARTCFLRTRRAGCGYWSVSTGAGSISAVWKVLGSPRLSFGKAALLEEALGVGPGGVTPFALINDRHRRVRPLLDRAMLELERLNYHPLTNAATTTIPAADLPRFIEACGHRPRVPLTPPESRRVRTDPAAPLLGARPLASICQTHRRT
jgi:hypothetical protein